jgi:Holliday junction resolvase RusA-like endonuclease
MIKFELKGIPISWKRPGHNFKTGAIYDQQKVEKEQVRWCLRDRYKEEIITGPVQIDFFFYFPIPKSTSKLRVRDMLNGVLHHISKPDVDNLSKFYLDTMTGVVYADDAQVTSMGVTKLYTTEPRTLIEITPQNCDMKKQAEIKEPDDNENDSREDGQRKFPRVIAFCKRGAGTVLE